MPNRNEKAGRLDRRITIQRATTAADGHGTPVETWEDVCTTWAHVSYPATGSGETQYDAVHLATTNVVFTIRHRDGLLHTDRIVYNSGYYDITRIAEASGPPGVAPHHNSREAYLAITAEKRK